MMKNVKHRMTFLAAVLVLVGTLLLGGAQAGRAQDATPGATPAGLPDTPLGDRLAWVFAQLNGGAATLTEADLTANFAPAFLANVLPAPALLDLFRQTAATNGPVARADFAFPPTATGAVVIVDLATGEHGALYLTVEVAPPHRITRLDLTEAPAPVEATGRRVAVGDRALYLDCRGTGSPTVVLEGGIVSDWAAVQSAASGFARVCAYDRPDSPGSRSDPTAERTAQEVVDDLRSLLAVAGEPGPFVLVGHSMGGLYVQFYAYQHPDEVAGLVLVDPTPEEFSARLAELVASLGTPVPTPSAGTPLPVGEISFAQMRAVRAASAFPPVPLVVLTHGRADDPSMRPSGWPIEEEERIWRELHEEIVRLAPNGRHVIAEGAGHDIHQERPEFVIEAIREVVAAVRDPGTWATPVAWMPTPH
jgi:pimeloyl-ACP methyl ester carboxylesterase